MYIMMMIKSYDNNNNNIMIFGKMLFFFLSAFNLLTVMIVNAQQDDGSNKFICNICGDGFEMTQFDSVVIEANGQTCQQLSDIALEGGYTEDECDEIILYSLIPCGCTPTMASSDQQSSTPNCYTNLDELAANEAALLDDIDWTRELVLCPNTVFPMGRQDFANPSIYHGGYRPIQPRPNAHYKCGSDGSSLNDCVIHDGDFAILTTPNNNNNSSDGKEVTNVVFQGLTIQASFRSGVLLAQAGDITFIDCIFKNHFNLGIVLVLFGNDEDAAILRRDEPERRRRRSLIGDGGGGDDDHIMHSKHNTMVENTLPSSSHHEQLQPRNRNTFQKQEDDSSFIMPTVKIPSTSKVRGSSSMGERHDTLFSLQDRRRRRVMEDKVIETFLPTPEPTPSPTPGATDSPTDTPPEPTPSPVQQPPCVVCPNDADVEDPDEDFNRDFTCGEIQELGRDGDILEDDCPEAIDRFSDECECGTLSPTPGPTFQPTFAPTTPPTPPPTQSPTQVPSSSPTTSPTEQPSSNPTSSNVPTNRPSPNPTSSISPSLSPTTLEPSYSPSEQPSKTPSSSPTGSPSELPSSVPTIMPSEQPSETPSMVPSSMPTIAATLTVKFTQTVFETNRVGTKSELTRPGIITVESKRTTLILEDVKIRNNFYGDSTIQERTWAIKTDGPLFIEDTCFDEDNEFLGYGTVLTVGGPAVDVSNNFGPPSSSSSTNTNNNTSSSSSCTFLADFPTEDVIYDNNKTFTCKEFDAITCEAEDPPTRAPSESPSDSPSSAPVEAPSYWSSFDDGDPDGAIEESGGNAIISRRRFILFSTEINAVAIMGLFGVTIVLFM